MFKSILLTMTVVFTFMMTALAQSSFKKGDRVEADINMSGSPENARWEPATVVEIMMWEGRVSGIYVKTDKGSEHTLAEKYLRLLKGAANPEKPEKTLPKAGNGQPTKQTDEQPNAEFAVGDRVEVDSIMASETKDSKWVKATVKAVDLKNKRYLVLRDDLNEMSVLIRPGKVWIRPLNDGSQTPAYATCRFYKNYQKFSNSASPSAELFKAVIFEWFNSINKYRDFGLEFVDFKMGGSFKNRFLGNGRKEVDPAPVGTTIYSVKTKIVKCEKDIESTYRTEWTNEYSCYKNQFGEWSCKNGAPQNYKRDSFPNQ